MGLTFHGLRHSVATDLCEAGFDSRTIADIRQKTTSMAERYSSKAYLPAKLKRVVRKLERKNARQTKVSTCAGQKCLHDTTPEGAIPKTSMISKSYLVAEEGLEPPTRGL
jgi:hypothetical protein